MLTDSPSKIIEEIICKETSELIKYFNGPDYYAIQNILRRLDFILLFSNALTDSDGGKQEEIFELYSYGWPRAIMPFYSSLDITSFIPYPEMDKESIDWTDSYLSFCGRLSYLQQLVDFCKAGLIDFKQNDTFDFSYFFKTHFSLGEYYDRKSFDFYRNKIIEKRIEELQIRDKINHVEIESLLKKIIQNPQGKFISYVSTEEIEEYYSRIGHYHLLKLQGYDDFSESDVFGGIEYGVYLDIIEAILGDIIMHRDACMVLMKMNPKVDPHNIITYTYYKNKIINNYSNYHGVSEETVERVISCITLNKENFQYYLDYPSVSLPIYIQVSNNIIVRMASSCMVNPFELLKRELKRQYPSDYYNAVNNREGRFRNELFLLFPQDHIIKIPREINISFRGLKTDIDAVVYNKNTGTLGLFQLKWQDRFARSMKERYSRISNLFKNANIWIDKIHEWLSKSSAKEILNTLQINHIDRNAREINNICVFVLSRNNINFTNVELDEKVAWGTWYQLIESQALVKTHCEDPIIEMYTKLKYLTPKNRIRLDDKEEMKGLNIEVANCKVFYDKSLNLFSE